MTDEGAIRLMEAMCASAADEFTTALKGYAFALEKLPSAKEELKRKCEQYVKEQDRMTIQAQRVIDAEKNYHEAVLVLTEDNSLKNKRRVKTLSKYLTAAKSDLCKMSEDVTKARKDVNHALKDYLRTKELLEKNAQTMKKEADWFQGNEAIDPSLLGIEGDMVVSRLIKNAVKKGIINEESGKGIN